MEVTFADIEAARSRLGSAVFETPCAESSALSDLCGSRIYCKLEYLQRTGSFKERGACNALLCLDDTARRNGVVAASAGNHALALAFHGQRLGIPVTVVMPRYAPLIKQQRCRGKKANVILHGDSFDEARCHAMELAREQNLTYVHGFNDQAVIAGQGTIGLEIIEQVPEVQAVIVPLGGAGLMAGVSLAIKHLRPDVEIIGVEAENAPCWSAAVAAGKPVPVKMHVTLADGLAVGQVGSLAFEIARSRVDRVVSVSEQALALAVVRLMELEKSVVEGAGASPLAAMLSASPQLAHLADKNVVLCLCGGNIDLTILHRLIETGLVADGRLVRFSTTISDRPGGLAKLTAVIAESGASIQEIAHDRAFAGPDVTAVNVLCTVETRDRIHGEELFANLTSAGFHLNHSLFNKIDS